MAAAAVAYGVVGAPRLLRLLSRDVGDATSDPTRRDPRRLVVDLIDSLTRWELTHQRSDRIDIDARVDEDRPVFKALVADLADIGTPRQMEVRRNLAAELVDVGVAPDLAAWASRLPDLRITPDIAALGRELGVRPGEVAAAYAALDEHLGLDELGERIASFDASGRWAQAARAGPAAGPRRASAGPACAAPCAPPATATRGRRSRPTWAAPPTRWPTRPRSGATSTPIRAPASTG